MIIDEKVIMPPSYPPSPAIPLQPLPVSPTAQAQLYTQARISPAPSSYGSTITLSLPSQPKASLAALPAHILLQIIHHTFPYSKPQLPAYHADDTDADYTYVQGYITRDTIAERQRRTLLWLSSSLRIVSRTLYTACMHVLRSMYLPAYLALVRAPYTSDPFPMGAPMPPAPGSPAAAPPSYAAAQPTRTPSHATAESPLASPQRETAVLDRFIVLKIRHDVLMDESSLHLDREDAFRDLFEVAQPRARLEDLVRELGARRGIVFVPGWGAAADEFWGVGRRGEGASPGAQLMREVDAQVEHAAAVRAQKQAQAQPQPPPKKSFFSFKKSAPSTSSSAFASSSSSSYSSSAATVTLRPAPPASEKTYSDTPPSFSLTSLDPVSDEKKRGASPPPFSDLPPDAPAGDEKARSATPPSPSAFPAPPYLPANPPAEQRSSAYPFSYPSAYPPSPPSPSAPYLTAQFPSLAGPAAPSPYSPPTSPTPSLPAAAPPSPTAPPSVRPLPFPALSVSFQPRRIGLVLARTRTIAEVPRAPGRREPLEALAARLVGALAWELGAGSG